MKVKLLKREGVEKPTPPLFKEGRIKDLPIIFYGQYLAMAKSLLLPFHEYPATTILPSP